MAAPQGKVLEQLPGLTSRQTKPSVSSRVAKATLLALVALAITFFARIGHEQLWNRVQRAAPDTSSDNICPQVPELTPVKNNALWQTLAETYGTEAFRLKAVDWLSGAVQIP